jgi:hypothetical protein
MEKLITVDCVMQPEDIGFDDRITVFFDNIFQIHVFGRRTPNPYKQLENGKRGKWSDYYACVAAPQICDWECWSSPKHGKCMLLNGGGAVSTINDNPLTPWGKEARCVEIHKAYSDKWPGSSACTTIVTYDWPKFINLFEIGEKGKIKYLSHGLHDYGN